MKAKDVAILIANMIIHFETGLYGFLAPVLAPVFFPSSDPIVSLIMAYSVFATSVITRPVGSYIFGSLVISVGANRCLILSLLGVGIFTIAIGFLPTYNEIGIFAPALLILLRMFIGLFASGEHAIAKFYIIEDKTDQLAIRSSYLYQASSMIGLILASSISTFAITFEAKYLWRLCYIFGGIIAILGIYLRRFPSNSKSDSSIRKAFLLTPKPLKLIWQKKSIVTKISIVYAFSHITYSTPFILLNSLMPEISGYSLADMMGINNSLLVVDLILIPVIGIFIEKYSPSKIMGVSALVLTISIIPLWFMLKDASFLYIFFFRGWIVFWGVMFACPFNLWCSKQISSEDKYLIYGAASTFGAGFLGHLTPAICLYIFYNTGHYMWISLYLATIMLVTTIVVWRN